MMTTLLSLVPANTLFTFFAIDTPFAGPVGTV